MDYMTLITNVLIGLAMGAIYGYIGYKALNPNKDAFSGPKFIRALVWGAFVGGVLGYLGIEFSWQAFNLLDLELHQAVLAVSPLGASFILDQLSIAIWKRIPKKYRDLITKIFTKKKEPLPGNPATPVDTNNTTGSNEVLNLMPSPLDEGKP